MDFPSPLEEWSGELTALLRDFFSHLAAIKLVQDKHFDGIQCCAGTWKPS